MRQVREDTIGRIQNGGSRCDSSPLRLSHHCIRDTSLIEPTVTLGADLGTFCYETIVVCNVCETKGPTGSVLFVSKRATTKDAFAFAVTATLASGRIGPLLPLVFPMLPRVPSSLSLLLRPNINLNPLHIRSCPYLPNSLLP